MTFEFSRKRLAALGLCLLLLLVFSFFAGLVAGVGVTMPTREELAELRNARAESRMVVSVAPPKHEAVAAPPLPQPGSAEAQAMPLPDPPPEPSPRESSTSRDAAPAASQAEEEGDLFALQLGSFLDAKNASQLQADLKARGYNTTVTTALDGEQREWHLVRMGAYKTLESAARAAADFNGKERMNALVRRSNTL